MILSGTRLMDSTYPAVPSAFAAVEDYRFGEVSLRGAFDADGRTADHGDRISAERGEPAGAKRSIARGLSYTHALALTFNGKKWNRRWHKSDL